MRLRKWFTKPKTDSELVANVPLPTETEFVPMTSLAKNYVNALHRMLNESDSDEKVSISISGTLCVMKFEKADKTFIKLWDGVWKEL